MSSSLLLPLFFQYPVLLTLVLLLLDRYKEKGERRGRDVLDGAHRLVRRGALTVLSQVQAAVGAAGHTAGPNTPMQREAHGRQRLAVADGQPVCGTRWQAGLCRVADGLGGGVAGVRPAAQAGVRQDALQAGVQTGHAGGPRIYLC